jgi:hypothetical protein
MIKATMAVTAFVQISLAVSPTGFPAERFAPRRRPRTVVASRSLSA